MRPSRPTGASTTGASNIRRTVTGMSTDTRSRRAPSRRRSKTRSEARPRAPLLADPDDARHPCHVGYRERAFTVGFERLQLDRLGGPALELLGHDLAVAAPHHD